MRVQEKESRVGGLVLLGLTRQQLVILAPSLVSAVDCDKIKIFSIDDCKLDLEKPEPLPFVIRPEKKKE